MKKFVVLVFDEEGEKCYPIPLEQVNENMKLTPDTDPACIRIKELFDSGTEYYKKEELKNALLIFVQQEEE